MRCNIPKSKIEANALYQVLTWQQPKYAIVKMHKGTNYGSTKMLYKSVLVLQFFSIQKTAKPLALLMINNTIANFGWNILDRYL